MSVLFILGVFHAVSLCGNLICHTLSLCGDMFVMLCNYVGTVFFILCHCVGTNLRLRVGLAMQGARMVFVPSNYTWHIITRSTGRIDTCLGEHMVLPSISHLTRYA